ncbi:MAG: FecR domain-containing protein [Chitinophagaceae bacterium]|nr:FecR domain-containing protein [Chitinophagaceae bacterium]
MDINRLEYLVKKYFNNNITDAEQQELAALVQECEGDTLLKDTLEQIWESYKPAQQMPDYMSNRILHNLFPAQIVTRQDHSGSLPDEPADGVTNERPGRAVRRIPVWKYVSIAASFALVFLLTRWLILKNSDEADTKAANAHVVSAQKGSRSKVELPDGTSVWLNAGSYLEYDNDFGKIFRQVSLTGEAFFDVTHNAKVPFIIHTDAIDVKVLGTTFNVRAYPEENRTEAALISGSLEVSFANQSLKKVILKPSEKISVSNKTIVTDPAQAISATTVQAPSISSVTYLPGDHSVIETSWVNNKLVFRNKPFEEVVMEMSRWYNVNFEVHDKSLLPRRFTATFETETIHEALTQLSVSYNFSFTYDKTKGLFIINK